MQVPTNDLTHSKLEVTVKLQNYQVVCPDSHQWSSDLQNHYTEFYIKQNIC